MSEPAATTIQRDITATLGWPRRGHIALIALALCGTAMWAFGWSRVLRHGFGVMGLNHPVMWATPIANFVFWVGIAHSGTLISAILFLFRARFRTAIYRCAEAMTVFAVMTAGMWPIIHLGRAWLAFWLFPYPNQRHLWVNFRSPLVWDVFAVSTYFIVSALFLYTGLVPDIAALRDSRKGLARRIYGVLALGWRGGGGEWRRFARGYLFFAAMATPLVISVHSVVSWDFAMSLMPGWHSTIFAPYFVAGAILSGVAMVVTILVPLRKAFHLQAYITIEHFSRLARLLILTSLIVSYAYAVEFFMAFWSGNPIERDLFLFRATGTYAPLFWLMVTCNCIVPLLCLSKRVRATIPVLFVISLLVNVGMYLERFIIVVTTLAHGYEPFAWGTYRPTVTELMMFLGSFGWFSLLFLVFIKAFPSVALAEMKEHFAAEEAGHGAVHVR